MSNHGTVPCPVRLSGMMARSVLIGTSLLIITMLLTNSDLAAQTRGPDRGDLIAAWTDDGATREREDISDEVVRERPIRVQAAELAAGDEGTMLRFEMFEGLAVDGLVDRRGDGPRGRFTLSGRIDTVSGGSFILAINGDSVAGLIRMGAQGTYRLRARADGSRFLQEIDVSRLPICEVGPDDDVALPAGQKSLKNELGDCDDGSVIDLLVVYTTNARDEAGGIAAIEAEIDLMVADANNAYINSNISTQLNLVYVGHVTEDESNLSLSNVTGTTDGILDGIHALRDAYGADQVALIRSGGGGVANGLWSLDPLSGMDALAFNNSGLTSAANAVLAHEIGHNLGCCHAFGDGGGCPAEGGLLFSYSNGHRFDGLSATLWRTIMAYSPGTRIQHFSNPNVLFDGIATGIAVGEAGEADNAQTINASAYFVSNHRCNDTICESLDLPSDSADCDANGVPDACDIALGNATDCDSDGVSDACQILDGTALDLDNNGVPDHCQDCNDNGQPDIDDVMLGIASDCNRNLIPDECEPDCNANGTPDTCDMLYLANSPVFAPIGDAVEVSFELPSIPRAGGTVTFDIESSADLALPDQTIELSLNGFPVKIFFNASGQACGVTPDQDQFQYGPEFFNFLVELDPESDLVLKLTPSATVSAAACGGASWATLSMRYTTEMSVLDLDANGILDECQGGGDVNGDGVVDVGDLVIVLAYWGSCAGECPGDTDLNGVVDVWDLIATLQNWG